MILANDSSFSQNDGKGDYLSNFILYLWKKVLTKANWRNQIVSNSDESQERNNVIKQRSSKYR